MYSDFTLYTNGSCPRENNGGWCFILQDNYTGAVTIQSGGVEHTNSERITILAILQGLTYFCTVLRDYPKSSHPSCLLVSDSKFVLNSLELWIHVWKRNDWCKLSSSALQENMLFEYCISSKHKLVKELDLWKQLYKVKGELESNYKLVLSYQCIKVHSCDPLSARCSKIASKASQFSLPVRASGITSSKIRKNGTSILFASSAQNFTLFKPKHLAKKK